MDYSAGRAIVGYNMMKVDEETTNPEIGVFGPAALEKPRNTLWGVFTESLLQKRNSDDDYWPCTHNFIDPCLPLDGPEVMKLNGEVLLDDSVIAGSHLHQDDYQYNKILSIINGYAAMANMVATRLMNDPLEYQKTVVLELAVCLNVVAFGASLASLQLWNKSSRVTKILGKVSSVATTAGFGSLMLIFLPPSWAWIPIVVGVVSIIVLLI